MANDLSAIGDIINEIGELLTDLPSEYERVRRGIQECLIDAHQEFEDLVARESTATRQVADLKRDLRHEKEQVKLLRHKMFSGGSDNNFGGQGGDDFDQTDDEQLDEEERPPFPRGKQKKKLPRNIKTIKVDHFPEERLCPCGCEMKVISSWTSSRLVMIPEHLVEERHTYYTMACNRNATCKDNKPVSAHAGSFIMRKRKFDVDLVIEAVCQKFYEHSTHFRQERRYGNRGHNVARQTIGRNASHVASFFEPLTDEIWKHATAGKAAHMDETPLRVQAKGKCERGYLWAICRDERGWNEDALPAVYYQYDPSRAGLVAEKMLAGALLKTIQTDGYTGYNLVRRAPSDNDGVTVARCMAHVRRKFTDAEKAAPSPLAKSVIKDIKKLYQVEKRAYGHDPSDRERMRITEAKPILDKIRASLLRVEQDLPKGALKNAANYFLDAWEDLNRYIYDGRLEIDTDIVEQPLSHTSLSFGGLSLHASTIRA